MIVVLFLRPKTMMLISVAVCLMSTILISFEGDESAIYLFSGTAIYGLAISWHYGAGVAWTAEHMDIVVRGRYHQHLTSSFYTNRS